MGKVLWLATGVFFGHIFKKNQLWNKYGKHVGLLNEKGQVFAPDGSYVAEVLNDRLVVNSKNRALTSTPFIPEPSMIGMPSYLPTSPIELPEGYEAYLPLV